MDSITANWTIFIVVAVLVGIGVVAYFAARHCTRR
jgi:hypothetical protein